MELDRVLESVDVDVTVDAAVLDPERDDVGVTVAVVLGVIAAFLDLDPVDV